MAFIDYTDLKVELDQSKRDNKHEELLNELTNDILNLWDEETNRTWASTTFTEYHSAVEGQKVFMVDNFPITAITDIWDDPTWEYEDGDKLESDDYTYDSEAGIVYADSPFMEGQNNIKITYTAGYTNSNFPASLKRILIRQAAHWFKQAMDQRWDLASKDLPGGAGAKKYNTLKSNYLPDFERAIERNRRLAND